MALFGLFNRTKKPNFNEKLFHGALNVAIDTHKKNNSRMLVVSDIEISEILERMKQVFKRQPYKILKYDKLGDAAAILTSLNKNDFFIFYNIEDLSISESDIIADALSNSKLVLDIQRRSSEPISFVEIDLVTFSAILIIKAGATISEKLFNCFDTKIYLGAGCNLSFKLDPELSNFNQIDSSVEFQNIELDLLKGQKKMSKVPEMSAIDKSNIDFHRYVSCTNDRYIDASIVYVNIKDTDGFYHIFGAYYGYCGGGSNDGGFFYIDLEHGDTETLDYSDVEELGESSPTTQDLFNNIMREVWLPIADEEDVLNISEYGKKLFAQSSDPLIHVSVGFDAELLSDISNQWRISTRFES